MARVTPRVKVPATAAAGDIVEIKTLISHPMESGLRKDEEGNTVPRRIIHTFRALFDGEEVFSVDMNTAVAANPFISFPFRAAKSGTFTFVWVEDGGAEFTENKDMQVG